MHALRRLVEASWAEKATLVHVTGWVLLTRLALTLLPFRKVRQFFDRTVPVSEERRADPAYGRRVAWAAQAVGRRILGKKPCLTQALVVQHLLRRAGCPSTLHIGVAKDGTDRIVAHAWVENRGEVVIGGSTSASRYAPIFRLEATPDVESGAS